MSSWLFLWLFEFLSFLVHWWRKKKGMNSERTPVSSAPLSPLISSSFSSFAFPDLYPPVCTRVCSGLTATVASQNRAPPVRGERRCLGIDWARHALWWLMLKRFLTKRICKRCVTHKSLFPFLHSRWWASSDRNSQIVIFSLLTYWQDAGRGLNGG